MSELGFLLELFLNHKLPRITKALIAERIKEVEIAARTVTPQPRISSNISAQAPSTQAALMRQDPVEVIAHTSATANALASRQQAINDSISGKRMATESGRPRKF
jgi:hypothetical protein